MAGWLITMGKTVLEAEGNVAAARDALALLHKAQAVAEVKEEIISEQQQYEAQKAQDERSRSCGSKWRKPTMKRAVVRKASRGAAKLDSDQRTLIKNMEAKLRFLQPQETPQSALCPKCDTPLMIRSGEIVHCDLNAFEQDEDDRAAKRAGINESLEVERGKLALLHADAVSLEEIDRAADW